MRILGLRTAVQILLISTPVVAMAADSASAPIVRLEYDHQLSFSKYRSYSWVPRTQSGTSDADYQRARASIDRALASRFKRAEPGDFAIAISGIVGRAGEYQGSYHSGTQPSSILSIDIYDTATKRPFWHGVVSATPGDLERAVGRLINYFPPSHGCDAHPANQLFTKCPP